MKVINKTKQKIEFQFGHLLLLILYIISVLFSSSLLLWTDFLTFFFFFFLFFLLFLPTSVFSIVFCFSCCINITRVHFAQSKLFISTQEMTVKNVIHILCVTSWLYQQHRFLQFILLQQKLVFGSTSCV